MKTIDIDFSRESHELFRITIRDKDGHLITDSVLSPELIETRPEQSSRPTKAKTIKITFTAQ